MSRTIYALLVGIDAYPAPLNPLRGCVNDIARVRELLAARVAGDDDVFTPLVLTNAQATREAVMHGFRNHLSQAGPDDVALFYYSGHGSQQPSPPEFWMLEPDRLDETLVCYDSRLPGKWDLADKELAHLIFDVADSDAHVIVILDCCHSGSGTRNLDIVEEQVTIRRVPTDHRVRPVESFAVTLEQAQSLQPDVASRGGGSSGGWYSLPNGRHVVLSACSAEEEAKELRLGGEQRGAFSFYLLETLQRTGPALSYRDLFKRVNAQVRLRVSAQSPQMEATTPDDLSQPFLGGVITSGPAYFTLSFDPLRQWLIDGGAVHGIPAPIGDETTHFALFAVNAQLDQLSELSSALGSARVTEVFPGQSKVAVTLANGAEPNPDRTYKCVVTAQPLAPLLVALEGDDDALALLREALSHAGVEGAPSLSVRFTNHSAAAFIVRAVDNRYSIRRKGDGYALTVDTLGFSESGALLTVQRLEHIARWMLAGQLDNPTTTLASGAVQMVISTSGPAAQWTPVTDVGDLRLDYLFVNGQWRAPRFKVKLVSRSNRRLYCMLFDLPETYGIFPVLPGGGVWLEPGQEVEANQGNPFFARVLDKLWESGVIEFRDTLKLVFSTDECDATLMAQDDLPVDVSRSADTKSPVRMNSFNRLMARLPTRHIGSEPDAEEAFADWNASEFSFTTVRPQQAVHVPDEGGRATLGHGITLHGHPTLAAQVRLTDMPQASRDAGNLSLPPLLRDNPDMVRPLEFTLSRSGQPGLSVLELIDVANYDHVTPDKPLILDIDQPFADGEALLTFGFDGEFYLPAGYARRTGDHMQIVLERLPAPTRFGIRSLAGAIRIYFQKMIGQRIGLDFPYPVLAVANVADDGEVTVQPAPDAVAQAVANADRILLYVHGITGDGRSLATSARPSALGLAQTPQALADSYNLILTFDYESVSTTIEQTSRDLKQRLASVGLGPNHDKTLHVVAHSMGGLVSRWLIEREGGDRVVQHLMLVGTPSAGSPWPTVQDWAFAALAIGLNGLSVVAWPIKALGALISATEMVDVALDEMRPDSDFLSTLSSSADPGVPYTIIAGNTSIIPSAATPQGDEEKSRLERLWARMTTRNFVHTAANLAFFNQPNDMAVSVESIRSVPDARDPRPVKMEAPCDHISYFVTEAGLRALAHAVEAAG